MPHVPLYATNCGGKSIFSESENLLLVSAIASLKLLITLKRYQDQMLSTPRPFTKQILKTKAREASNRVSHECQRLSNKIMRKMMTRQI